MQTRFLRHVAVTVAAAGMLVEAGSLALAAPNYGAMSCSQLWYARNSIYAQQGYCFKTAQARSVFGPGCFPPYGKLTGWQSNQVSKIQYWERQKGC